MREKSGESAQDSLCEATVLKTIGELGCLYQEFPLESQIWARDGHRRSPYRALVLFGLSPRTKDRLLVAMCRRFFAAYPDLESFLKVERSQSQPWTSLVRAGQVPFIESAQAVLESSREVPRDAPSLMRIRGVGAKVAECVIGYGWGMEALPVDANVSRVVSRLGGLSGAAQGQVASEVREQLKGLFNRHRARLTSQGVAMIDLHELLRLHGQAICTRLPQCWQCPLSQCQYRQKQSTAHQKPTVNSALWDEWRELLLDPTCGNIRGNQPADVA